MDRVDCRRGELSMKSINGVFPCSTNINPSTGSKRLEILDDCLEIIPLGAGCEVGRSCIVIKFKGKTVMFDCGIHPALSGVGALPLFEAVEMEKVNLCLITHFHLDHCGALPYLIGKTGFRGRTFMTAPTKALCKLLWLDYAKMGRFCSQNKAFVANIGTQSNLSYSLPKESSAEVCYDDGVLYEEEDVEAALDASETLNFHQQCSHADITFTAYNAGHVLGACMFLVEIPPVRILYTGDYSREVDRHVPVAEIPPYDVHVLICESTYGIRVHDERRRREMRLLKSVHNIINRRGKCLLPTFALGRAQEILLILEEYWHQHRQQLSDVPIFYVSPMFNKSLEIFETFIDMCGPSIIEKANEGLNPFNFKYVKTVKCLDAIRTYIHQEGSCVVIAAPGMLQSGASREIFEIWAPYERNGVILTGYAVKGTIADDLRKESSTIVLADRVLKRRCSFEEISFSAHSDFNQTQEFIEKLQAPNVVLVHGERGEVYRLKQKLTEDRPALSVFAPEILQKVQLSFSTDRSCYAIGDIAQRLNNIRKSKFNFLKAEGNDINIVNRNLYTSAKGCPVDCCDFASFESTNKVDGNGGSNNKIETDNVNINGVMIINGLEKPILVEANDIKSALNGVDVAEFEQKLKIPYAFTDLALLTRALMEIYEDIEKISDTRICICDRVNVELHIDSKELCLSWKSSALSDLIGDSISYIAIDQNRYSMKSDDLMHYLKSTNKGDQSEEVIRKILTSYLVNLGALDLAEISRVEENDCLKFKIRNPNSSSDLVDVEIDFLNRKVKCDIPDIQKKLQENLRRYESALLPIARR